MESNITETKIMKIRFRLGGCWNLEVGETLHAQFGEKIRGFIFQKRLLKWGVKHWIIR